MTTYRLVGEHFGYIVDPSNYARKTHVLRRSQASRLDFRVRMVLPSEEALLFTALTSWPMSSFEAKSSSFFPLIDEEGNEISVRRAYQKNSELFEPSEPYNFSSMKILNSTTQSCYFVGSGELIEGHLTGHLLDHGVSSKSLTSEKLRQDKIPQILQ